MSFIIFKDNYFNPVRSFFSIDPEEMMVGYLSRGRLENYNGQAMEWAEKYDKHPNPKHKWLQKCSTYHKYMLGDIPREQLQVLPEEIVTETDNEQLFYKLLLNMQIDQLWALKEKTRSFYEEVEKGDFSNAIIFYD